MLLFYKRHFFFFLHKHVSMNSRTRLCRGVTVESICQFVRAELSQAEMITERSDPETNMLFMLLANIAQSELANQNRRIWRGVPTVNNNMAVAIARKIMRFS